MAVGRGGCRGKDWPERRRWVKEGIVGKPSREPGRGEERKGSWFLSDGLFVPLPGSKFIYLTRPLGLKIYMKI